jgi:hypothetical protein
MSMMFAPATYPAGFVGNPYTPNDISIFDDMNWPPRETGVQSTGFTSPGLLGLGQSCDACQTYDPESPTGCDGDPCSTGVTTQGPGLITPVATPSGNICDVSNEMNLTSAQLTACGYGSTPLNTPLTPAQAGLTAAQQAALITATGNSAVSLIRTAEGGPYTVAGTNLVYNPATGTLSTAASVNATATAQSILTSIEPYLPYILLAVAAVVVLPMITGKK